MYKVVLFDLFGTLIPAPKMDDYRQMVSGVAATLGIEFDTFFPIWMSVNDKRLGGSFGSSEGDIIGVADLIGISVSDSQMAECMRIRRSITRRFLEPKPRAIEMLGELKSQGVQLGLVTDCVYDVPAVWSDSAFAELFSATHFSCQTGIRKPHATAYRSTLETLGIAKPAETLFVGDGGSDELNGAVRCGLDAVMVADQSVAGDTLRVGVTDWAGPVVTDIAQVTKLVTRRGLGPRTW